MILTYQVVPRLLLLIIYEDMSQRSLREFFSPASTSGNGSEDDSESEEEEEQQHTPSKLSKIIKEKQQFNRSIERRLQLSESRKSRLRGFNFSFGPHKIWTPTFKILAKRLLHINSNLDEVTKRIRYSLKIASTFSTFLDFWMKLLSIEQ